jgi:nitronate monooxygenase
MIRAVRARTDRAFLVNVFCHAPPVADPEREAAWVARLAPVFARYGAAPPARLREVYTSFVADDAMLAVLVEERPPVVSFHFGLPGRERVDALRSAGCVLLATATNLDEGRGAAAAGVDAVVAQGYEAGGAAVAALHPRLRVAMNVVDLAYFVSEHDDYHLARITELLREAAGELSPA